MRHCVHCEVRLRRLRRGTGRDRRPTPPSLSLLHDMNCTCLCRDPSNRDHDRLSRHAAVPPCPAPWAEGRGRNRIYRPDPSSRRDSRTEPQHREPDTIVRRVLLAPVPRSKHRLKIASSMRPRRSFRVSRSAPSRRSLRLRKSEVELCESSRTIACRRAAMHSQQAAARLRVQTAVGAFNSTITLTPRSYSEGAGAGKGPFILRHGTGSAPQTLTSRRRS